MKMKLVVFFALAFAGLHANACVEPSADETKAALTATSNYFVDGILARKGVETFLTTLSISVADCHEYDGEFDHLDIEISWRQKVKNVYQNCKQTVGVDYQAKVNSSEDIECVSDTL